MSLIGRIGNGMRIIGTGLAIVALSCMYSPKAQGQFGTMIRMPTIKGPGGDSHIGAVMSYDENGEPVFGIRSPMGIIMPPPSRTPQQSQPQEKQPQQNYVPQRSSFSEREFLEEQERRYAKMRMLLSDPVLWRDRNRDGIIQVNEVIEDQPKVGEWYNVSARLINGNGVFVNISVTGYPDGHVSTKGDDIWITQKVFFKEGPTLVRFGIGDYNSAKAFYPKK